MLSLTAEYALQAVLYLAPREAEGAVKIEQIADALGAPRNYLSKTLHQLARAGILSSERGPNGGFRLAIAARELTLEQVVAQFDPATLARRCLLGWGPCSDDTPCAAHDRWTLVATPMRSFFRDTTVADLLGGAAPAGPRTPRAAR